VGGSIFRLLVNSFSRFGNGPVSYSGIRSLVCNHLTFGQRSGQTSHMLNQKKNRNRSNSHFARCLNLAIGLGVFAVFLIPACVHEPILPVDPGGNTGDTVIVDPVDEPCLPDVVYFERDILPILRSNCAKSGCHDAISHQDGNVFDSYQNVMASDEVDPFDPGGSDLYEVITDN